MRMSQDLEAQPINRGARPAQYIYPSIAPAIPNNSVININLSAHGGEGPANVSSPDTASTLALSAKHHRQPSKTLAEECIRSSASLIHQNAMALCGFGSYQWSFLFFISLGISADGVQVFMLSYILPSSERDLCMTTVMKGWLSVSIFFGMMLGSGFWGTLADTAGRRGTLMAALSIAVFFSIASAFSPSYITLFIGEFCTGVGMGGSVPLIYTYFGELCPKSNRGFHITFATAAWAAGGLYAAIMAYAIIPATSGSAGLMNTGLTYAIHGWRILMMVCILPGGLSLIGISFFDESPLFLLENDRYDEAYGVYKKMYRKNHGKEQFEGSVEHTLRDLIYGHSSPPKGMKMKKRKSKSGWNNIKALFAGEQFVPSVCIIFQWFTLMAAIYGVETWFPEYLIEIEESTASSSTTTYSEKIYKGLTMSGELEYTTYTNTTFVNMNFYDIEFNTVKFIDCEFNHCAFNYTRSAETYFYGSTVRNSLFYNYDFYYANFGDTLFMNCKFEKSQSCEIDFGATYSVKKVYLEDLIGALCFIPPIFLHGKLADWFGRVPVQFVTAILASVATLTYWLFDTELEIVIADCLFGIFVMMPENGLGILTVEQFPTSVRSTGIGIATMLSRVGAISILLFFTYFIDVDKAVPIILTATLLFLAGCSSLFLKESKDWLL